MPRKEPALTKPRTHNRARQVRKVSYKPRVAPPRFRVLPLTIIMAFLLFGLKVTDVYQGTQQIRIRMQPAMAEEKPAQEETAQVPEQQAAPKPPPSSDPGDKQKELAEKVDAAKAAQTTFSQIELDILQSLSERREEIEERNRQMDLKEKLLEGTEMRINDKLAEMKQMKQQVEALLVKYNEEENKQIKSLVKIYESMKPKSAAQIFDELDMPILLDVIDQMSERKVAPVLAGMDPMKAKQVTAELAEARKLRSVPRTLN